MDQRVWRANAPLKINWPSDLVGYARRGSLGFFVGNGVSRLSGAPAWGDLFRENEVVRALNQLGVSVNDTSYIELADILTVKRAPIWEGILTRLIQWAESAQPNNVHHILAGALKPAPSSVRRKRVFTSNIDSLLSSAGLSADKVGYCHGSPGNTEDWIFSISKYWDTHRRDKIDELFRLFDGEALLFVGYGHSSDDFDIGQAVQRLSRLEVARGCLFSLISRAESHNGALRERLDRLDIRVVEYDLPEEPTLFEREVYLSDALLQLAQRSDRTDANYSSRRKWCDCELSKIGEQHRGATIVLGLAAVNTHLQLNQGIPSGGRRFSMKARVQVEAGGPGYIISKIIQALGYDACLVSKIATDPAGALVGASVSTHVPGSEGRIFRDFLDTEKSSIAENGFRTWQSFILEPLDERGSHRVFIDQLLSTTQLELSVETIDALMQAITGSAQRVFYFDKFFSGAVRQLLQPIDSRNVISPNLWTVYETGSEGDRYSGGKISPSQFVVKDSYHLERYLSGSVRCVNVLTASYRFARDYLAKVCGDLDDESYRRLVHKDDSEEIIAAHPASESTEDQAIEKMLNDGILRERFVDAVRDGGSTFLREHDLRIVIVTLHARGCLVVPANGTSWHLHVPGIPVAGRLFTASAGDVFRGVLVAALAAEQRRGQTATDLMEKDFWSSLGALCNECASIKVITETFEKALPLIQQKWHTWHALRNASKEFA